MTRRNELPPDFRGRPFRVLDARDAGVPWDRLLASDLARLARGARVPVGRSAIDAIAAIMTPDQAFAGPTAA
ncbi:MAG: hypothetical protein ABL886_12720, partial [Rhodoglobus sp.]